MEPAAVLQEEHEAIATLADVFSGLGRRTQSDEEPPMEDLAKALTVATEFADRCHHAKEEKILFPALAAASPEGAELGRRLTSDHRAFRKLIESIRELIPEASEPKARHQLAKNLGTYARLLQEHIRIEDKRLLPEIEKSIPSPKRAKIAKQFERLEEEEIGSGVHEKYHRMIRELAAQRAQ